MVCTGLMCILRGKGSGYCYRHGSRHQPSWVCLHEKMVRRKLWRYDDHLRYLWFISLAYGGFLHSHRWSGS